MTLPADPMHGASPPEAQRLAAAEARASLLEQWLDLLLATSPAAVGIISVLDNRYVRANPAMVELYGLPLEKLLNSDPFTLAFQITHPDDLVQEQVLFAELASGARRSYRIEKRFVRPDGSIRWGLLDMSALLTPPVAPETVGSLSFAVVQVIDITAHKALAETLQRREAELRHTQKIDGIGRLAAGIAHDFNNLLTVITGHGEVLQGLITRTGGAPLHELQEDLTAILTASERAAALTAQLLAHGRRETAVPRTHPLSDLVASVHRLLWRTLGSDIEVEQSLLAAGAIFADRGQVGQVVMNLILNARDAMSDGGIIRLETQDLVIPEGTTGVPGPGQWVSLLVADTGHGMDAEVQARIFEPFFTTRADRPGMQGSGLGLSTVQRIVAELGGQIHVQSAPGAGTQVTIFFPRVANTAPSVVPPPRQPPVPAPNSRRVLVIEDEPSVRSLVATVLTGAHYWVMVARNGEEGLRALEAEQQPFHLIVTDLVMPRIGGIQLAQRLLERGDRPRLLFISGYSNHAADELLPYGELLPKPFTPKQLLAAVAQALGDPL